MLYQSSQGLFIDRICVRKKENVNDSSLGFGLGCQKNEKLRKNS